MQQDGGSLGIWRLYHLIESRSTGLPMRHVRRRTETSLVIAVISVYAVVNTSIHIPKIQYKNNSSDINLSRYI